MLHYALFALKNPKTLHTCVCGYAGSAVQSFMVAPEHGIVLIADVSDRERRINVTDSMVQLALLAVQTSVKFAVRHTLFIRAIKNIAQTALQRQLQKSSVNPQPNGIVAILTMHSKKLIGMRQLLKSHVRYAENLLSPAMADP